MAKDGTNRGGTRIGAGRKPKPMFDKITEGKVETKKRAGNSGLPEPAHFSGVDVPPVKDYLKWEFFHDYFGREINPRIKR